MKWFAVQESNAAALRRQETCCGATYRRHPLPIHGYGSDEMRRLQDQASSLVELLRPIRLEATMWIALSQWTSSSRRQLVPAALWLADYWACLCVASGQKPSALLEKSHEKIMRRVATTASPSERVGSPIAASASALCSSSMFISIICDGLDDRP